VLDRCDAVMSGYLGGAALGEVVLATVARVKAANAHALYACDPVIGDYGRGVFVREGIPEFFRDYAMTAADLITPNQFELAWLTGRDQITDLDDALRAAAELRRHGPETVFVTSLEAGIHGDRLGVLAVDGEGAWLVQHPRLDVNLNGTGDVMTALLTGERLLGSDLASGLARAVSRMFALVEATHAAGAREMQLVQAQERWLQPPTLLEPQRVG